MDIAKIGTGLKRPWIGQQQAVDTDEYDEFVRTGVITGGENSLTNIVWKQAKVGGSGSAQWVGESRPTEIRTDIYNDALAFPNTFDFANNSDNVTLSQYAYKTGRLFANFKDDDFDPLEVQSNNNKTEIATLKTNFKDMDVRNITTHRIEFTSNVYTIPNLIEITISNDTWTFDTKSTNTFPTTQKRIKLKVLDWTNFYKWVDLVDHVGILIETDKTSGAIGFGFSEIYDTNNVADGSNWEYFEMTNAGTLNRSYLLHFSVQNATQIDLYCYVPRTKINDYNITWDKSTEYDAFFSGGLTKNVQFTNGLDSRTKYTLVAYNDIIERFDIIYQPTETISAHSLNSNADTIALQEQITTNKTKLENIRDDFTYMDQRNITSSKILWENDIANYPNLFKITKNDSPSHWNFRTNTPPNYPTTGRGQIDFEILDWDNFSTFVDSKNEFGIILKKVSDNSRFFFGLVNPSNLYLWRYFDVSTKGFSDTLFYIQIKRSSSTQFRMEFYTPLKRYDDYNVEWEEEAPTFGIWFTQTKMKWSLIYTKGTDNQFFLIATENSPKKIDHIKINNVVQENKEIYDSDSQMIALWKQVKENEDDIETNTTNVTTNTTNITSNTTKTTINKSNIDGPAQYFISKDDYTYSWGGNSTFSQNLNIQKTIKYVLTDSHADFVTLHHGTTTITINVKLKNILGNGHRLLTLTNIVYRKEETQTIKRHAWLGADNETLTISIAAPTFNNQGSDLDTFNSVSLKKTIVEEFDVKVCMQRVNQALSTQDSLTTLHFKVECCFWILYDGTKIHDLWDIRAYPGKQQKAGGIYHITPTIT